MKAIIKKIYLFILITACFALSSCAWLNQTFGKEKAAKNVQSAEIQLFKDYLYNIDRLDGINLEEAGIIAQCEIFFRSIEHDYYLSPEAVLQDQVYWQVKFKPRNKTWMETFSKPAVFILINKTDGIARLFREESMEFYLSRSPYAFGD